jgi:pantoate--beta-alanine ligase
MITVRTIAEIRDHVAAARATGANVGLVPTMGALHDGHLALMRAASEQCDEVVASVFVNPAQFEEAADLAAYPRDEARDAELAAAAGVDALFVPPAAAIYPPGFATTVAVSGLTDRLEGAVRGPGHFAGVCTVVAKLFNIVAPDVAYFGAKDAQQVAVVRRMATDLDLPIRIEVVPTVRDPDGLALSSRNARLSPAERERAVALSEALVAAAAAARDGAADPAAGVLEAARRALAARGVEPEYLELVDPDDFMVSEPTAGRVLLVLAARIGATRLIDNARLDLRPPAATG